MRQSDGVFLFEVGIYHCAFRLGAFYGRDYGDVSFQWIGGSEAFRHERAWMLGIFEVHEGFFSFGIDKTDGISR
jgi:hypothetical protein